LRIYPAAARSWAGTRCWPELAWSSTAIRERQGEGAPVAKLYLGLRNYHEQPAPHGFSATTSPRAALTG